jgi:hypothetical protein
VPPHRGPILSLPSTSLSGGRNDPQFAVTVGWGVTLPNPPEYYAINAIEVDEEGGENDPCFLRLWGNTVDPSFSKNAKDRRLLAKYELPTAGRRDGLRRPPHLRGLGVDRLERMGLEKELVVGVSLYIHGKYFSGMTVLCKTLTAAWGPTPIKDGDGY